MLKGVEEVEDMAPLIANLDDQLQEVLLCCFAFSFFLLPCLFFAFEG